MAQTWLLPLAGSSLLSDSEDDISDAGEALRTLHSGLTEPTSKVAYMLWADTTAGVLKIRNAANSAWITVGTLASTNLGLLALSGGTMTGNIAFGSSQKCTGLAAGSGAGDSVRYEQAILASGVNAHSADQSFGGFKATSLAAPAAGGDAANKTYVDAQVAGVAGMPTGALLAWSTNSAPTGYLLCDGTAVSRTTYSALFAVVGTTYGVGDGSTTFNLPDIRGRIPVGRDAGQAEFDTLAETGGAKTHTLVTAEMPSHRHSLQYTTSAGAVQHIKNDPAATTGTLEASAMGTTGGDGAHNNLQPYIVINYVIKT